MARTKSYLRKVRSLNINLSRLGLKESQSIRMGLRRHLNRMRALEFDVDDFLSADCGPHSTIERSERNLMQRLKELDDRLLQFGVCHE